MWIAMATMLATFNFHLAKDADAQDIDFEAEYMNGMSRWVSSRDLNLGRNTNPFRSHPLTFPCHIAPRAHINQAFLERVHAK